MSASSCRTHAGGRLPLEQLVGLVDERRDVEDAEQRRERDRRRPQVDAADVAVEDVRGQPRQARERERRAATPAVPRAARSPARRGSRAPAASAPRRRGPPGLQARRQLRSSAPERQPALGPPGAPDERDDRRRAAGGGSAPIATACVSQVVPLRSAPRQVEEDVVAEDHRDPDDEPGELAVAGDLRPSARPMIAKTKQATGNENFCWMAIISWCGDRPARRLVVGLPAAARGSSAR